MVSLCLAPAEEIPARSEAHGGPTVLVAGFGNTVAAHYAARVGPRAQLVDLSHAVTLPLLSRCEACVLFLERGLSEVQQRSLDDLIRRIAGVKFVAVISTFGVHFGDRNAIYAESAVAARLKASSARVVVFRPGHLLGAGSRYAQMLGVLGSAYPLVPGRFRSCFVGHDELFAAIDQSIQERTARKLQIVTLLGPNRPWREVMRERGARLRIVTAVSFVLACLLVGHLAGLLVDLLLWLRPAWRCWNFNTLRPNTFGELKALCNRFNDRYVKIVGYNNGVNHFGHRYPGRTIVSTLRLNRIRRTDGATIKADCGATIRQARDFLRSSDQELFVVPNYSYVCLGTAFFIPIHGSASDFATVAETISRALLYDTAADQFILATGDERAFQDAVYHLHSKQIVLRLWIRVKPKSSYFALHQDVTHPDAATLLAALRDQDAANVEIRKARAGAPAVTISKYYKAMEARSDVVEVPRDSLGKLWDRLEENPLTSFLMHWFARNMIWHVELFLTESEFADFWTTHTSLPLRKIQLRYIRRDGLPHSPFREHDCVSVDVFVFRWHRVPFEMYLSATFGAVRTNPGKHTH